jgi:predicted DNA-binding protein with PD1-like motif
VTLNWSSTRITAFRLLPGADLKSELVRLCTENQLQAASIVSAVGSLSQVCLRLANRREATKLHGKHEIVSLVGTLSKDGVHLHMAVANSDGKMVGGHVAEGSTIYTTAEIVIAELDDLVFAREQCPESGFKELIVNPKREIG